MYFQVGERNDFKPGQLNRSFFFFITEIIVSFEEEISLAGFHSVMRYIDY